MPADDVKNCGNCWCWEPDRDGLGECRAQAPRASTRDGLEDSPAAFWPLTLADEYCRHDWRPLPVVQGQPGGAS